MAFTVSGCHTTNAVKICKRRRHNLAHSERSKSMYRLLFRWTWGSTGVTKTFIVSNKSTVKRAGTWAGAREKILEIYTGLSEKPRDGPVDEALIKHQIEIASWISIDWSSGYLKTSYFGLGTQWPLFASVCRGYRMKRPEVHINIA